MGGREEDGKIKRGGLIRRLAWFVGLWAGGTLTLVVVGAVIKAML